MRRVDRQCDPEHRRPPRCATILLLGVIAALSAPEARACPSCAAEFREALSAFGWGTPVVGLAVVAVLCVGAVLALVKALTTSDIERAPLRAGLLLGIGMGGFVDGIVLHQILQWHSMLSGVLSPIDLVSSKVNMFWDGIFHAAMWAFTAAGLWALWWAATRHRLAGQAPRFGAAMLLGWAVFNVVEGVVNHQTLGLHHVRDFVTWRAPWDWTFLVLSALIGLVSVMWLMRQRAADSDDAPAGWAPDRGDGP